MTSGLAALSFLKNPITSPDKQYFENQAAEFTYVRTYAKWLEEEGRRETWPETVARYVGFLREERGDKIPAQILDEIHRYILDLKVMPSMRLMHTAGSAAKRDNTCAFNCSYASVDYPEVFAEAMFILMSGCGFGFSVEQRYVSQLPAVPKAIAKAASTHVVGDCREGWADSVKALVASLYAGSDLKMDYSPVRPRGTKLRTMGGRASGPDPLEKVHKFIRAQFRKAKGRKLTSLECHDILNVIAVAIEVGGTRRSSEISLSDLSDEHMRGAKSGEYPEFRRQANNSAVYRTKPTAAEFWPEWHALMESGTGERGIFNLGAAQKNAPLRRNGALIAGVNPCGEITLRSKEMCNLSSVVARADDTFQSFLDKVRIATWIGAIQSTFTYFPYLSPKWKENCDEERLLGVSITGQHDAPHLMNPYILAMGKATALATAAEASKILGIVLSAALTCTKPEGSGSQVNNSAPGAHTRHSRYSIRRYRIAGTDPLLFMIRDQGVSVSPETGERESDWEKARVSYAANSNLADAKNICAMFDPNGAWSEAAVNTWVATFLIKAPEGCTTRDDLSALDMLEHYKMVQTHWCEHNVSMTVSVRPEEWQPVGEWVLKNWDIVNGLAFLPFSDAKYDQMPYEAVTKEYYEEAIKTFPKIDYSKLPQYELDDATTGAQEKACFGGQCEI